MRRAEVDKALSFFAEDANLDESQPEEASRLIDETHKQIRDLFFSARGNQLPFYEAPQEADKLWGESHNRIIETLDDDQISYFEEMLKRVPIPLPLLPPPGFPR